MRLRKLVRHIQSSQIRIKRLFTINMEKKDSKQVKAVVAAEEGLAASMDSVEWVEAAAQALVSEMLTIFSNSSSAVKTLSRVFSMMMTISSVELACSAKFVEEVEDISKARVDKKQPKDVTPCNTL